MRGQMRRKMPLRFSLLVVFGVLAYALLLTGIRLWGPSLEKKEASESLGSLAGRFEPLASLTLDGREYVYREGELENILLIGVDMEALDGSRENTGNVQADFLLLLSLDRVSRAVTPLLIDRDTMTPVPIYGVFGDAAGKRVIQICLAQDFAGKDATGSENTARAVEELLCHVPVDHYLAMDMAGITLLNDALGGVTVTLEDDFTELDPAMKRGETLRLAGRQAEYYVRGRASVSEQTNAARMLRQGKYMEALTTLFIEKAQEDAGTVDRVLDALEGHVTTDLSRSQMAREARTASGYAREEIVRLPGSHQLGADGFVEFHVDEDSLVAFVVQTYLE